MGSTCQTRIHGGRSVSSFLSFFLSFFLVFFFVKLPFLNTLLANYTNERNLLVVAGLEKEKEKQCFSNLS